MVGAQIKSDTVLTEKPLNKVGSTSYEDKSGNEYTFDNSEILFSPQFRESFVVV
jgi:hypothetical protein